MFLHPSYHAWDRAPIIGGDSQTERRGGKKRGEAKKQQQRSKDEVVKQMKLQHNER